MAPQKKKQGETGTFTIPKITSYFAAAVRPKAPSIGRSSGSLGTSSLQARIPRAQGVDESARPAAAVQAASRSLPPGVPATHYAEKKRSRGANKEAIVTKNLAPHRFAPKKRKTNLEEVPGATFHPSSATVACTGEEAATAAAAAAAAAGWVEYGRARLSGTDVKVLNAGARAKRRRRWGKTPLRSVRP